jgi:hypothetical protein
VEVPVEFVREFYPQQSRARGTYYQEQFFQALIEGRVALRQDSRHTTYRVVVTPPVQDPNPLLMATVDDNPAVSLNPEQTTEPGH